MINAVELVIIGAGGHGRVVVEAARLSGFQLGGIIDTDFSGQKENILGCPVIGGIKSLNELSHENISVFVAVGDSLKRAKYFLMAKEKGFSLPAVVHPTAFISEHSTIGSGAFINTAAIINTGAEIGENSIINSGSIIEHEVVVGKHSHVCPGVKIGGRVIIGENSFIGIGTNVIDYIKIGNNVTIGAGSVIIDNVESNSTIVGVPGRKIK